MLDFTLMNKTYILEPTQLGQQHHPKKPGAVHHVLSTTDSPSSQLVHSQLQAATVHAGLQMINNLLKICLHWIIHVFNFAHYDE